MNTTLNHTRLPVDINCDMGEGMGNEESLMPFIRSANIACGYHAGDAATMHTTAELAIQYGVAIGAHPSFPDREHFGRTAMQLPLTEVYDMVSQQLYGLQEIVKKLGAVMQHVKPHGALYNMAAADAALAATIARAVKDFDSRLVLFGLSGSCAVREAQAIGLTAMHEVFADRTYRDDGSLTPRTDSAAMLTSAPAAVGQVLQMIREQQVTTTSGKQIPVTADTVCIHGDGPHAVELARAIHSAILNL